MADTQPFGDKIKPLFPFIIGFIIFQIFFWTIIRSSENEVLKPTITECKSDSLNNVIDSLQTEIFMLEDGFDYKEHRYEDVILNYEIGLSYLKDYHPQAYKDFHRIIGMREQYSRELDRENKQRLNINE